MKYYLDCPFDEKEKVKALGAKWDKTERKWFYTASQRDPSFDKWATDFIVDEEEVNGSNKKSYRQYSPMESYQDYPPASPYPDYSSMEPDYSSMDSYPDYSSMEYAYPPDFPSMESDYPPDFPSIESDYPPMETDYPPMDSYPDYSSMEPNYPIMDTYQDYAPPDGYQDYIPPDGYQDYISSNVNQDYPPMESYEPHRDYHQEDLYGEYPSLMKFYLNCPIEEKDKVKALGAKWDKNEKKWFYTASRRDPSFDKWATNYIIEDNSKNTSITSKPPVVSASNPLDVIQIPDIEFPRPMKFYLNCPIEEKEKVKTLGARWDNAEKKWFYIANKKDPQFNKWATNMIIEDKDNSIDSSKKSKSNNVNFENENKEFPTLMRFYLNCPIEEKEKVKALGAKWDKNEKKWYYTATQRDKKYEKWATNIIKEEESISPSSPSSPSSQIFNRGSNIDIEKLFQQKLKEYEDIPFLDMSYDKEKKTILIKDLKHQKVRLSFNDDETLAEIMYLKDEKSQFTYRDNIAWTLDKEETLFNRRNLGVSHWNISHTFLPLNGTDEVVARACAEFLKQHKIQKQISVKFDGLGWAHAPHFVLESSNANDSLDSHKCYLKEYAAEEIMFFMKYSVYEGNFAAAFHEWGLDEEKRSKEISYITEVLKSKRINVSYVMLAYNDNQLEEAWNALSDIPLDYDKKHPDGYYKEGLLLPHRISFPVRTEKEDVWRFFDDNYSKGVAYLLYDYVPNNKHRTKSDFKDK